MKELSKCSIAAFLFICSCSIDPPVFPYVGDQPYKINNWIYMNIEYRPDIFDHWQTPAETLNRGAGDCEDMAILGVALVEDNTGLIATLIYIPQDGYDHMIFECEGLFYDPTRGLIVSEPMGYRRL